MNKKTSRDTQRLVIVRANGSQYALGDDEYFIWPAFTK